MAGRFTVNRMEVAGSLGDLGALLPIAIAMVMVNGMDPVGVFFTIAIFYLFSGLFFGVTVPVQPMKVIGAYGIAAALEPSQILASSLLIALFLLLFGSTGLIELIRRHTPVVVIRGVQFSTGVLLMSGGIKFIMGKSAFQLLHGAAEPFLTIQHIGPLPVGLLLGFLGAGITFLLLDNKKLPAALVMVLGGAFVGILLGARINLFYEAPAAGTVQSASLFHWPSFLPFSFPGLTDFSFALLILVLPQLPMTVGNAVFAYTDLSKEYFGDKAQRVTNRNACLSMAMANLLSFVLGGMPLCHGAGGLAAHYRFGARTAGSNLCIGLIILSLTLFFGADILQILHLLPLSVLGVLLVFAGAQLALTIMDQQERKDIFVIVLMLALTLTINLGVAFLLGILVARILALERCSV